MHVGSNANTDYLIGSFTDKLLARPPMGPRLVSIAVPWGGVGSWDSVGLLVFNGV